MAVLFCEIFMVKVKLVVFGQFIIEYFMIVDGFIGNFCVSQDECYGIVLWLYFFVLGIEVGCVDGNFRCFFKFDCFYIDFWVSDFIQDIVELFISYYFIGYVLGQVFFFKSLVVGESKIVFLVIK